LGSFKQGRQGDKAFQRESKNVHKSQWAVIRHGCAIHSIVLLGWFSHYLYLNNTLYTGTTTLCILSLISMTHYYSYATKSSAI